MEMHQIRYFLALAEELNFTRAAASCAVSQPALTRAVRALEMELDGELVRRERSDTHLTELGKRLLPLLRQSYDSAMMAKELARALRNADTAPLPLAVSHSVALDILAPVLAELFASIPGLQLTVLRGEPKEIVDCLRCGDAELAVAGPVSADWDRLDSWTLFSEELDIAIANHDPLSNHNHLTTEDLRERPIFIQSGMEIGDEVRDWLAGRGLAPAADHRLATPADLLSLVRSGVGIGIVPSSEPARPGIERMMIEELTLRRRVAVYAVAGRLRSAAGGALLSLLRARDWATFEP